MYMHFFAPIGATGYGNAALNILKATVNQNVSVALTPIGQPNLDNQNDFNLIQNLVSQDTNIPYDAPCLKIWHQFDLLSHIGRGKYSAYPFFEIDTFNQKEIYHLNYPDQIIVSSQWAKSVIEKNKINRPVNIVPLGVDTNIFKPVEVPKKLDNFIFLTIGKWEIRKSHDIVIECFNQAFGMSDNVELWMVTYNPFLNKEEENSWLSLVNNSKLKSKIKIFPRLPSQNDLAQVISYSDCGIYVSRAEGWNLELIETMAMNKPVIATNYSAHTEYCTTNNSFLVDVDSLEPAVDNKWFYGNGNWAKIGQSQKDQIIEYMRLIYNKKINTNISGLNTAQNFSWDNAAKHLVRCMYQ